MPEAANIWSATVLSLFPEIFPGPLGFSLAGKALEMGLWRLETVDIRSFARDKHRSVDAPPAGGGPGMVLRPDVLAAAVDDVRGREARPRPLIYLSPRGAPLGQRRVQTLRDGPGVVLICGRFEGVDERLLATREIEEVSLGDFILSGGEIAALALMDAVVRLLPGVAGSPLSLQEESFSKGLLEYPQYTKPADWEGMAVPPVLLSGNHAEIRRWRKAQAEEITRRVRPDLWRRYVVEDQGE